MMANAHSAAYEPFFAALAGVSATLWVIAVALVTIVLTKPATGSELGSVSLMMSRLLDLSSSRELRWEERRLVNRIVSMYRQIWFLGEMLPIVIFFETALVTSVAALLPVVPYWLIYGLILVNYLPVTWLLKMTQRNHRAQQKAFAEYGVPDGGAPALTAAERMRSGSKTTLPGIALFLLAAMVWVWTAPWTVAATAGGALLIGIVYSLNGIFNTVAAVEHTTVVPR